MKKKLIKIMKLSGFLLLFTVLQVWAVDSYSQRTKLTLNLKNVTVEDALKTIEDQSEFFFLYSPKMVDVSRKVDIELADKKVDFILNQMFAGTGVDYVIKDRQIVITTDEMIKPFKKETPQQIVVTGKVTDEDGNPLPGVNIIVKGTLKGTISDVEGNYSFQVDDPDATLVFSFIGFRTQEVAISGRSVINITLVVEAFGLEEVVAIGYGTVKVEDVTGAATSIKRENFLEGNVEDAAHLLKGKISGLSIINPSGDPLGGSQITLRGVSTLASGTQPLILIDGVPGDLNSISEEDISSISVLKSGAAAAIYGTRATNGVILIETITGITEDVKPTIKIKSSIITERIKKFPDVLTSGEFRELVETGVPYSPGQGDYGANTNWFDEITRNPLSYNLNLNIRGGNPQANYIINVQRKSQEGVILDTENKETKLRLKATHTMFDNRLEISGNVIGYLQKYKNPYEGTPYNFAMYMNPTEPVKDENNKWTEHEGQKDLANPVALIKETKGLNNRNRVIAYSNLIFRPIDDLSLNLRGSTNINNLVGGRYQTQNHLYAKRGQHSGRATRSTYYAQDKLLEFFTTYDKDIGSHSITGVGGYSWQQYTSENFSMTNSNFPNDLYEWNNIGTGTHLQDGQASMSSSKIQTKLIGFFFRANYDYKKKYYLMASLRHEGSSKFGTQNKWGNFPAISFGWNISREPFMAKIDFLSHLKLRGGYGITGTEPNLPYQSIPRLSLNNKVYLAGDWVNVAIPMTNPNPYLKWERKKEYNVGLDFGFFNDYLSLSADIYQRITNDLIWNYTVPSPPYLYDQILANAGTMRNSGVELSLNAIPVHTDNLTWNSTVNFSYNINEVKSLKGDVYQVEGGFFYTGIVGAPLSSVTIHRVEEGKPIGNFYGYKSIDLSEDGLWIIEGVDGNPKLDADKVTDDKQYLGNGLPDYYLSWQNTLCYKNFTLNISMSGAFGFQILNKDRLFTANPVALLIGNGLHEAIEPVYGKRTLSILQPRAYVSHYIEDGDYWKINNVSLSYNLKPKKSFIKNLTFFINGNNLITFTGYKGIDPEVNILGLSPGVDEKTKYPLTRSYSFGAEFTF